VGKHHGRPHHLLRLAKVLGALSLPEEGVGEGGSDFSACTAADDDVCEPKIVSNTESTTDVGFGAVVDADDDAAAATEVWVLDAGGRAVGLGAAERLAFRFAASTAASTIGDDRVTTGVVETIGVVTGAVVVVLAEAAAAAMAAGAALGLLTAALWEGGAGFVVAVEDAFALFVCAAATVDDGMRVVAVATAGVVRGNAGACAAADAAATEVEVVVVVEAEDACIAA
tara:strand:- start:251 stop:931 length:681 start_codon:yes stop_codon:yes gene_type:complete